MIWGGGQYLIDNSGFASGMAQGSGMMRADDSGPPGLPGSGAGGSGGDGSTNGYTPYVFSTNGLWLQITNLAGGLAYLNLNNATDYVYEILSTTNLALTNWNIETEVIPTNATVMPFTVGEFERTNLFIWARDWTGVTENGNTTPDWWFWEYFGTTALFDTNLDSQGINTLSNDYQNGIDPNSLCFDLVVTNEYVSNTSVPMQVRVAQGAAYYIAVLVDDTNYQVDAVWEALSTTNLTVNIGSSEGWHNVWVGLKGMAGSEVPYWQSRRLKLDLTPPQIVVTGPSTTVFQSLVQLTGYAPQCLSGISCSLSNSLGIFTNQQIIILDRFFNTNTWEFTTNIFQAFDVPLARGTNAFTIVAIDLAGNLSATNFSVTLAGDAVAPVIALAWPQDGMQLSGTNFTITGTMDDPSAVITATLVDANGDTNNFNGVVERDGQFWMDCLPLTSGTNWLTLTAVDVWSNTTVTNFSVTQSSLSLAIDPVDSTELYLPAINVTGTVGDPACSVWVNGVQGTNYGDGTWVATNVPVTPGGTASFRVSAYPSTDAVSQDTNNPGLNPPDPNASSTAADVRKDPLIYVESYFEETSGNRTAMLYSLADTNDWQSLVTFGNENEYWTNGVGGSGLSRETYIYDGPSLDMQETFTNGGNQAWPPSFWPNLVGGIPTSYPDGNSAPNGPPSIVLQHAAVGTRSDYAFLSESAVGTLANLGHANWQLKSQAKIKLFTGDTGSVEPLRIWMLSTTASEQRLVGTSVPYNDPLFSGFPVPSQNIKMGDLGYLDTNGVLYVALPNNTNVDITPTVSGLNYYTFTMPTYPAYTLIHQTACIIPSNTNGDRTTIGIGEVVYLSGMPDITGDCDLWKRFVS